MNHFHYKLYKPPRFLSQFVHGHKTRKNKKMLGQLYPFAKGTMPIGRLDENSEGLLLLTTDGKLCQKILSNNIEKQYYVQLDGIIDDKVIEKLSLGVDISVNKKIYKTKPCIVNKIISPDFPNGWKIRDSRHGPTSWISITLREGKNRQIRKMSASLGFPTLRLIRIRIGKQHIEDMQPGTVIPVPSLPANI